MKWLDDQRLICTLAKKSINLTVDNCNMYHDLEDILELARNISIGACYTEEQQYLEQIKEICKKHVIESE